MPIRAARHPRVRHPQRRSRGRPRPPASADPAGTGKTAAFGLPLLQLIDVENTTIQAVILAPTRELGQQIHANLVSFSAHIPSVSIAVVCGGIPIKPQIERLKITTHIVVATPGR